VEGLCGVLVAGPDGSGGDRPPPAALLRGGTEGRPWRVAAIPIADLGELVVATRRARGLGGRDLELLEGFAAMLARRLGAGRTDWRSRGSSVA
jgi:hypothetical protein